MQEVRASVRAADGTLQTVTRVRYTYVSNRLESIRTDLTPNDNLVTDNNVYTTTFTYNANGLVSAEPLEKALALAQCFEASSAKERLDVLERARGLGPKLLALSAFMAEAAMNTRDASWIKSALVMHLIEDFAQDFRENVRYLVLVAHAATRANIDLAAAADSVMSLASPRVRTHLADFLSRGEGLNSLAAFGIREDTVDGQSRFVPS